MLDPTDMPPNWELGDLARALRWRWRTAAVVPIAVIVLAAAATFLIPSRYRAEAALLVEWPMGTYVDQTTQARILGNVVEMLQSPRLVEDAAREILGRASGTTADPAALEADVLGLRSGLRASLRSQTSIVAVEVRADDRVMAAQLANTSVRLFVERERIRNAGLADVQGQLDDARTQIEEIQARVQGLGRDRGSGSDASQLAPISRAVLAEARSAEPRTGPTLASLDAWIAARRSNATATEELRLAERLRAAAASVSASMETIDKGLGTNAAGGERQNAGVSYRVVTQAAPPAIPERPRWSLVLAVALVLGLVGGLALALILESSEPTIRDRDDVHRALGLSTLAFLPACPSAEGAAAGVEALRFLQNRIEALLDSTSCRSLLIASADAEEGKTSLLHDLSTHMAASDPQRRIVILDAALRRPALHERFGVELAPGLGDLLDAAPPPPEALLRATPLANLLLIPAGNPRESAIDRLPSRGMKTLIADLLGRCDLLLVDSSAATKNAETMALARVVDAVLFVIAAGETRRSAAREALDNLRHSGTRILGVVLNSRGARSAPAAWQAR